MRRRVNGRDGGQMRALRDGRPRLHLDEEIVLTRGCMYSTPSCGQSVFGFGSDTAQGLRVSYLLASAKFLSTIMG